MCPPCDACTNLESSKPLSCLSFSVSLGCHKKMPFHHSMPLTYCFILFPIIIERMFSLLLFGCFFLPTYVIVGIILDWCARKKFIRFSFAFHRVNRRKWVQGYTRNGFVQGYHNLLQGLQTAIQNERSESWIDA